MTLEEIVDRLGKLAMRREQEGNYTDANICTEAAQAILNMEEALEESVNYMDHCLNMGTKEHREHREVARAEALTAINFGYEVNERGEIK